MSNNINIDKKYEDGKIYRMWAKSSYIGSTTEELIRRKIKHDSDVRTGHSYTTAKLLYEEGEFKDSTKKEYYDAVQIELLEDYVCNNREELELRERYWIEKFNSENIVKCVNIITRKTEEERKRLDAERQALRRVTHYDEIRAADLAYKAIPENKVIAAEYQRGYNPAYVKRPENIAPIAASKKKYKDKIKKEKEEAKLAKQIADELNQTDEQKKIEAEALAKKEKNSLYYQNKKAKKAAALEALALPALEAAALEAPAEVPELVSVEPTKKIKKGKLIIEE